MSYNKFEPGTIVNIDGADFMPQGYSHGRMHLIHAITGAPFVCPGTDGVVGMLTDDQFDQLLLEGRASLSSIAPADANGRLRDHAQWTLGQAMKLDPKAEKRLVQCQMLDDAGIPNGDKAVERFLETKWVAALVAKYGPYDRPRTIREWRTKRGRPGHRHANQMVSMTGRVARHPPALAIPLEVQWKHALNGYATRAKPRDVYASYTAEMLQINEGRHPNYQQPSARYPIASKKTIRRRINALESSETVAVQKGKQAVEQDWFGSGKPLTADRAFHRVIIDHTPLDDHAAAPEFDMVFGRPWLSLAFDVKTRACVAHLISFIDPSVWTAGEILRRMALPKRPPVALARRYPVLAKLRGKPTELIVDNAVEFRSHMMEAAARSAGFSVRFCPVKKPRYRAIGERGIGTITREICDKLPGLVLSLRDSRRFGHNAEDEACVLMQEIEAVANGAVAEYNTHPHGGIGERQPALLFEQDLNRYGINNFVDLAAFRLDTMDVQTDAQLSPAGIRAFGNLRYHDIRAVRNLLDDLVPLEARRTRRDDATATVDFRFDPMDIGRIHVWNRKTRTYVELSCADERYADGMPLWLHDQIRKIAKAEGEAFNTEEERLLARARRIEAIRNINPAESARARKAVAELYEIPRLRQITGNIVHLDTQAPAPVSLDEFISNDRAAQTCLDDEILSPRPAPRKSNKLRNLGDRRDASRTSADSAPVPPKPRQRGVAVKGGYK